MKGILGRKIGMTQVFSKDEKLIPVTVVQVEPNVVTQVKTIETDGYNAVQLGFGEIKEHKVNKPETGHFKKANVKVMKHLREFRACPKCISEVKVGDEIKVDTVSECNQIKDLLRLFKIGNDHIPKKLSKFIANNIKPYLIAGISIILSCINYPLRLL